MSAICLNELPGLGSLCKKGNPFAGIYGIVFSDPDFAFTAATDFADLADWQSGIAGGQLFPVMGIKEDEDTTPDDVVWEGPYGDKVFITEGKYSKNYRIDLPHSIHKKLREYNGKKLRFFKVDRNGNIKGTVNNDGEYVGFDISFMRIGKMADPTADTPAMTVIMIEEADPKQWNESGAYITPAWLPSEEIIPLTEVTATPGTVSTNVFDVVVSYNAGLNADGSTKSIPISGLVVGNFSVIDATGAEVTPTGVVESSTIAGTYTVTCTLFASGTVQVVATTDALYRSDIETVSAA